MNNLVINGLIINIVLSVSQLRCKPSVSSTHCLEKLSSLFQCIVINSLHTAAEYNNHWPRLTGFIYGMHLLSLHWFATNTSTRHWISSNTTTDSDMQTKYQTIEWQITFIYPVCWVALHKGNCNVKHLMETYYWKYRLSSWFWMTSLPGGWTSPQALANCFNVKTDLGECLMVKYKSTIKDEGRFQHVLIDALVVVRLISTTSTVIKPMSQALYIYYLLHMTISYCTCQHQKCTYQLHINYYIYQSSGMSPVLSWEQWYQHAGWVQSKEKNNTKETTIRCQDQDHKSSSAHKHHDWRPSTRVVVSVSKVSVFRWSRGVFMNVLVSSRYHHSNVSVSSQSRHHTSHLNRT